MTFTTILNICTENVVHRTREFTYDSCIPTIRTDLIPHAANK